MSTLGGVPVALTCRGQPTWRHAVSYNYDLS